jgi:hypothetical protein
MAEGNAKTANGSALDLEARLTLPIFREMSVVQELKSVVTATLQRAVRLRQSILQKAFSGGLV